MSQPFHDAPRVGVGFQQIIDLSSVVTLSLPSGATPNAVLLQAEGAHVRWRDDSQNPTSTVGMLLKSGTDIWYVGNPASLKIIEASAGAVLNASFYEVA